MPNPNAVYNALIAAVVQAPPAASGGAEDVFAVVAEGARRDSPDLSSLRSEAHMSALFEGVVKRVLKLA